MADFDSDFDSDSDSDSDVISEFLKAFPKYHLHRNSEDDGNLWVFCSQDEGEGSQNNSSSADRQTTGTIQDKIKSALSHITKLSTSGQPFAVNDLRKYLVKYRRQSIGYEEFNTMIITSSLPVISFPSRFHSSDISDEGVSTMIPICCPAQSSSSCVGVIEYSSNPFLLGDDLKMINKELQETGLSIFGIQEHIPYKTLYGLKPARIQIDKAIEIVCASLDIPLAQVWIAIFEDVNSVTFPSSLVCTQKKQMLAVKLSSYYNGGMPCKDDDGYLLDYYDLCDMVPLDTGESFVEKTLQDYESRYYRTYDRLNKNQKSTLGVDSEFKVDGIVICLRSIGTGDFCYVFEFFWDPHVCNFISLGYLLLELMIWLPSFKFASGAELGDELHVIDVENSTESDIRHFKLFEGKGRPSMPEALGKGKKVMVMDDIAPPKRKHKTAPKCLPQERIELQFGKTMKEAADNLKVSLSTLKRKCKDYGIKEWQGPSKIGKRKVNHSCNQSETNEEDSGAILVLSALERNENALTIKAAYSNDMIKFDLLTSEATFFLIESEIGKRFNLTPGTYKLKYRDEDSDWISLTSEQDMLYCIRSLKKLDRTVVRLRVIPSAQQDICSDWFQWDML